MRDAQDAFDAADEAYANGDFEEWGRFQEEARAHLSRAVDLANDRNGEAQPEDEPTDDSTDAPTDDTTPEG